MLRDRPSLHRREQHPVPPRRPRSGGATGISGPPSDDGAQRGKQGRRNGGADQRIDFLADVDAPEEAEREPETAFEEFAASWVPPWARSQPELVIEPASDYTLEELSVGRFAYANPDAPKGGRITYGFGGTFDQLAAYLAE